MGRPCLCSGLISSGMEFLVQISSPHRSWGSLRHCSPGLCEAQVTFPKCNRLVLGEPAE